MISSLLDNLKDNLISHNLANRYFTQAEKTQFSSLLKECWLIHYFSTRESVANRKTS